MQGERAEITAVFWRIGWLSFGGPAAQVALMHRILVEERRWLDEAAFLRGLSFAMILPGPEAMQLATWAGWKRGGVAGGLIAGGLFLLPGAAAMLALAAVHARFGQVPLVQALFLGVQAAVVAIVIEAVLRLSRRALTTRANRAIALAAFLGLSAFALPFPLIVAAAVLLGAWLSRGAAPVALPAPRPGMAGRTLRVTAAWALVWAAPLVLLALLAGRAPGAALLLEIGLFFSQLAAFGFGGAYAVLAWMAQVAVEEKGWLTLPQVIDGLGLAEATPGPLILVTGFAGYLAGAAAGGAGLALGAALVAFWVTFVPSFLWIMAGAPWIDRLAGAPRIAGALSAVSAAVVGVIAHLGLWFALQVLAGGAGRIALGPFRLMAPVEAGIQPLPAALALLSAVMILWLRLPLPLVLAVSAGLSAAAAALA